MKYSGFFCHFFFKFIYLVLSVTPLLVKITKSAVNWCIGRSLCDKCTTIGTNFNDPYHIKSTGL